MKKLTSLLIILLTFSIAIVAQTENLNIGVIKGQLVSVTHEPVAYASISIFDTDEKLIIGTISEENGTFLLEKVTLDTVILDVQFLGYQTYRKELVLSRKIKKINLESIILEEDAKQLEEVVVTAEKSKYSLQLDKKVFEVGKDAMSQGGSALDVLEQVPLVTVEPSGGVSLRGSSAVQILINGKRSGLTMNNALDQIPSDNIEKVEVITNPSASFDASGSAGIINIVLKKNKGEGWNGQIGVRAGTPADYSVTPGINYSGKKINFFSNLRWRYSDYIGRYTTEQQTFSEGNTSFLNQREDENRHDDGRSGYFGADYSFDEQNSITLAYFRAETKDTDLTLLNYNLENNIGGKNDFLRTGNSVEARNYNQIEANYTHEFLRKGEKLTFDFQYD
ncbi:MAG: outer membrane receptor protein involved in Fe transport, partial [Saprospiraceae bacterium]